MSYWKPEPVEGACAAIIHSDHYHQCTRKPVEGTKFCKQHTKIDENAPPIGYIFSCIVRDGCPTLFRARVLKRTVKQLVINAPPGGGSAFGYRSKVSPQDYASTATEAVDRFRKARLDEVASLSARLDEARRLSEATAKFA